MPSRPRSPPSWTRAEMSMSSLVAVTVSMLSKARTRPACSTTNQRASSPGAWIASTGFVKARAGYTRVTWIPVGAGGGGGDIVAPSPPPSQPPTLASASKPRIAGRRLTWRISSPISTQRPALNQDAAIHDDGHARLRRASRRGCINHAELQPERREPESQAIVDDRGDVLGAPEDIDDVDWRPSPPGLDGGRQC